jgi:hypothetical protein
MKPLMTALFLAFATASPSALAQTSCRGTYDFMAQVYPGTLTIFDDSGEFRGNIHWANPGSGFVDSPVNGFCSAETGRISFERRDAGQTYSGAVVVNADGSLLLQGLFNDRYSWSARESSPPVQLPEDPCDGVFRFVALVYPGTLTIHSMNGGPRIVGDIRWDNTGSGFVDSTITGFCSPSTGRIEFQRPDAGQSYTGSVWRDANGALHFQGLFNGTNSWSAN